jgi:uncharacterized protein (TIGR02147 family)
MEMLANDYIDILNDHFVKRRNKNSKYSLRAFARDLGVSPQRLSHILNGKHGLSVQAAVLLSQKLSFNESEQQYFCTLVEVKHSRSILIKNEAQKRLTEIKSFYKDINMDHFKVISDWHHFAIMELTLVKGFSSNQSWIAKTLGISELEVKEAIKRLLKLKMLKKIGRKLMLTGQFFAEAKGAPSESLRQFHKQLMQKAMQAIDIQPLNERDYSSIILALDEEELVLAKDKIQKFRDSFDKQFSASKRKTKVYCLGVQLFNLQEKC